MPVQMRMLAPEPLSVGCPQVGETPAARGTLRPRNDGPRMER